ncbi:MAG TPA: hypothetical protein VN633_05780 [Bryobacteraceae bacterium]|nr:hypothetical protein [Bryobacteraceae bacterium]
MDQLSWGLSLVPHTANNANPSSLSYGSYLESLLTLNPNASIPQILDVISRAGWNPFSNYGEKIAAGDGFPGIQGVSGLIECPKENDYLH